MLIQIANVGDESEEEVIVDQTLPPSTKITKSAAGTTDFNGNFHIVLVSKNVSMYFRKTATCVIFH